MIAFTKNEIEDMAVNPEALHALANYHSAQETMADASGDFPDSVEYHRCRRIELREEADRIEAEWLLLPNVELTRLAVGQSGGAKRNES